MACRYASLRDVVCDLTLTESSRLIYAAMLTAPLEEDGSVRVDAQTLRSQYAHTKLSQCLRELEQHELILRDAGGHLQLVELPLGC